MTQSQSRPDRRPLRGWLFGAVIVALLAWLAGAAAVGGQPTGLPVHPASTFVPEDGARRTATFSQDGTALPAMMQQARIHGLGATRALSLAAFISMGGPEGVDPHDVNWWREATVGDDITKPNRYRLRSITDDGIRLHAQVWDKLGLTFGGGLLELPAEVKAGQTWSSEGLALGLPTTQQLHYANTSQAKEPTDPQQAADGCLEVTSTTELTGGEPDSWTEINIWCPERGVVRSSGTLRGHEYLIKTSAPESGSGMVRAEAVQPPELDPTDLKSWRQGVLKGFDGDASFGDQPLEALVDTNPPSVVNKWGTISYVDGATGDLISMARLDTGEYWKVWWGRPRGHILSMTPVGGLVVVTTSEATMEAYDPLGTWQWTVELDDVSLGGPVRVGDFGLAVTTLGGRVSLFDVRDGRQRWSHQSERGISLPAAADSKTVAVVDTDRQVMALDAATGEMRWKKDYGRAPQSVAVTDGVVMASSFGQLAAYEAATGKFRWVQLGLVGSVEKMLVGKDSVVVRDDLGLHTYALADGVETGRLDGAEDFVRVGDLWFVLRGDELLAVDGVRTIHRWPLKVAADKRALAVDDGRVWVLGREPGDVVLTGEWVGTR